MFKTLILDSSYDRQNFLNDFYATAKASFDIFDYYTSHAEILASFGYASLIQSISDISVLNSLAVLSIGLHIPDTIMDLLCNRSVELGQDLDSFYSRAVTAVQTELCRHPSM